MSEQEIWDKVLETAEKEIAAPSYNTFIKGTELYSLTDEQAVIVTDEDFTAGWLEKSYTDVIKGFIYDVIGHEVEPKFYSKDQLQSLSPNLNLKHHNSKM